MIDDMGLEQLADIRRALTLALNASDGLDQLDAARRAQSVASRSSLTSKLADAIDDLDSLVHRHKPQPAKLIVKRPTHSGIRLRPSCGPVGEDHMPPISTGMPWHAGMLAEAVKNAQSTIRIRSFDDWPFLSDDELFPHIAELHRRAVLEGASPIQVDKMIAWTDIVADDETRRVFYFVTDSNVIARLRHLRESVTPPTVDVQQLIESRVRYGSDAAYRDKLANEYRQQTADARQRLADAVRGPHVPTPRDLIEKRRSEQQ